MKEKVSWGLGWILSSGPNEDSVKGFARTLGLWGCHSLSISVSVFSLADEGDWSKDLQVSFSPQIL